MLTEANGLLYMRARYYSPDLMRFINEDIVTGDISNSNSLNRYSYVEGNPVTMVDPFGLCGRSCISSNQFERRSKVASLSRTEYMWDLLVQTCKYEFYQNASPETLQTIGDVCDVGATFFDYLGQVLDNTSKISGQVAKVSAAFTGGFAAGGAPLVLAGPAGGAVYTGGVALGTTVTAGSTIIWCGSEALAVVSNGVAGNLSNEADRAHAAAEAKSSSPNPNGKKGGTAHQNEIAAINPTNEDGQIFYEVTNYKQSRDF